MAKKAIAKTEGAELSFNAIETIAIDSIEPHPQNARKGKLDVVAESLAAHGQYKPIVVNQRNRVIVAGHHTWMAAKDIGWTEIAVVWVDLSPSDHKRVMLMDNRSSDIATNDSGAILALLQELSREDTGLLGTGYDDDALLEGAPGSADLVEPGEDEYYEQYAVTIPCDDEEMQKAVYDAVTELGYKAKAVSV